MLRVTFKIYLASLLVLVCYTGIAQEIVQRPLNFNPYQFCHEAISNHKKIPFPVMVPVRSFSSPQINLAELEEKSENYEIYDFGDLKDV